MDTTSLVAGGLLARFETQRAGFARQPMPDTATRRSWLAALAAMLKDNQAAICEAIDADFGHRSGTETRLLELYPSLEAIKYTRRHVAAWMTIEPRRTSPLFQFGRSELHYQPLGVVGIMAPWNYPLYLSVGPLAGALAAGNRAMVKPSEYSPWFGALFARLVRETFAEDLVTVVLGDVEIASAFAGLPFDHLLFTGSTAVGRAVMTAAAKNLTPVTLELGGKCPVLIAPGQDLAYAAHRVIFAKLANAGQTCVAPDYVLLPRGEEAEFLVQARAATIRLYGEVDSPDYASIAHQGHYARLMELIRDARVQGARIEPLCAAPAVGHRKIAPVAMFDTRDSMRMMREEIFGPILPVVPYERVEDAIAYVNARPRPLALYVFDRDRRRVERTLHATASGGVAVNDCLLQIAQDDLPFGGTGASGMGRYHGPEGFKTFSQLRSVFRQSRLSMVCWLYPPYARRITLLILRLMAAKHRRGVCRNRV
jgi:acyl-CoA reductase-like NAD-dependent aldehyde dehydrogenase